METLQIILLCCAAYIGLYAIVDRICRTIDNRSISNTYVALGTYNVDNDEDYDSDTFIEKDEQIHNDIRIGSMRDADMTFGEGAGYCYSCRLRKQCYDNGYINSYCILYSNKDKYVSKTEGQLKYFEFLHKNITKK